MVISTRYILPMQTPRHIRELITRLARLDAASGWDGDLNPTQRAALSYLAQANRFSRSPSHLSDYLGSTRGTVSQSLKSLLQKGYVSEKRSALDKRVISYELTAKGEDVAQTASLLETAIAGMPEEGSEALRDLLMQVLGTVLQERDAPGFGVCKTCCHHKAGPDGRTCGLLSVPLTEQEADQICFEQVSK